MTTFTETLTETFQATKGVVTRYKRRAAAAVCPCCHRTFRQLAAHLAAKHPDFVADAALGKGDAA